LIEEKIHGQRASSIHRLRRTLRCRISEQAFGQRHRLARAPAHAVHGTLDINGVHDGTLQQFVADRLASGVTATTVNRSLSVVRTVLNRAARVYRDDHGRPWLEGVPPLITMLAEKRRPPYQITWVEQDRLFARLPARLARMTLFAVNMGVRESNV
jgi:hypothetical protein